MRILFLLLNALILFENSFAINSFAFTSEKKAGEIWIVSAGDTLLGDAAQKFLDRFGYDYPMKNVWPLLNNADIAVGNLEGVLTTFPHPLPGNKTYYYKADPARCVDVFNMYGFNAFNLANNHILDFQISGLEETRVILKKNHIRFFGAGLTEEEAREPAIFSINGTKIALFGYMQFYKGYQKLGYYAKDESGGVATLLLHDIKEDILKYRGKVDIIIVNYHWGGNYRPVDRFQEKVARKTIDLGADAVTGHGAHMAHPIEIYKGRPIVYNLGNFIFGTPGRFDAFPGTNKFGLVTKYIISAKKIARLEVAPILVDNKRVSYQPRIPNPEEARDFLKNFSQKYKTNIEIKKGVGVIDLTQ